MKFRFTLPQKLLLPVLIGYYSMNFMDRSVLGIVGEAMKADMGFTDAQLGLLHSILLMTLIALIFPCSIFNDLFKRRLVIGIGAGLWGMGMALTAAATGFAGLVFARILGSANEAATGSGGTAWLSSIYPAEKRGRVLGTFQMSAPLGMALGTLLGGGVLALTGSWRLSFALFVVPALAAAFCIPRLPDRQPAAAGGFFAGVKGLLRVRTILLGALATGLYSIIKYSYQTWMPVLLIRSYGLEPQYAAPLAACFLLAGACGPYLGGMLADAWSKKYAGGRVKAASFLLFLIVASKALFYCMMGRVSLPVICVMGIVDGIVLMMPIPAYFSFIQDVVSPQYRSSATGLFGTLVFFTGGAWGPLMVGVLSDWMGGGASGLLHAMTALLAFAVASGMVFGLTVRSYIKESVPQKQE
ncbi:MAG: MFS transporter [Mailhella sp.]|nr:MFS transporter [Mailhella sp.]